MKEKQYSGQEIGLLKTQSKAVLLVQLADKAVSKTSDREQYGKLG